MITCSFGAHDLHCLNCMFCNKKSVLGNTKSQRVSDFIFMWYSMLAGFGAFGGLGQSAPANVSGATPFGKGLSLGAPSTPFAPSPITAGFGQPSSSNAAAASFAGFGQSAPAIGQPQTSVGPAAPSSGAFSLGFGQSSGLSAQPSVVSSGFGQPFMMGAGFGQAASPGVCRPQHGFPGECMQCHKN